MDKENNMNVLNISTELVSSADISLNSTFDTNFIGEIGAGFDTFEILDFLNLRQILLLFLKSYIPAPFTKSAII